MPSQKNILLLYAEAACHTGTVELHVNSFKQYSRYNIVKLDSHVAGQMDLDVTLFDAIVFHYSIVISLPQYVNDSLAGKISAFNGPKILFIQDEFRWVNRTMKAAEELGISVVFTVVNKDVIRKIYNSKYFDNVRFEQTLTGFIPENLLEHKVPDYNNRTIDIGYRARKLPGWCGSFAIQKWQIGAKVLADARKHDLRCDIAMSEASRIYGDSWIQFMCSCRATLGTESGASFVDFTGLVHQEIDQYEAANPDASFEEVRDRFLEGRDGEIVIHVISPRIFEAAALRVLMVLYPGTYSGVLKPGRHYVELLPDHSNMDEVVAILRDPEEAGAIIQRAYDEVACSSEWTHESFIGHFDCVAGQEFKKHAYTGQNRQVIETVNQHIKQLEKSVLPSAEHARKLAALESVGAKGAKKLRLRMWLANWLNRSRNLAGNLIDRFLPSFLSRPILRFSHSAAHRIKPIIKKVLLKY